MILHKFNINRKIIFINIKFQSNAEYKKKFMFLLYIKSW